MRPWRLSSLLSLTVWLAVAPPAAIGGEAGAASGESFDARTADSGDALYRLIEQGRDAAAVELGLRLLAQDPCNVESYDRVALAFARLDRVAEGGASLAARAAECAGAPALADFARGVLQSSAGDAAGALPDLEAAVSVLSAAGDTTRSGRARLALARFAAGKCLRRLGRTTEAIAVLGEAAGAVERLALGRYRLRAEDAIAGCMGDERRHQEALALRLELIERAATIDDPFVHGVLLQNLGYTCYRLGDYRQSVDYHLAAAAIADSLDQPERAILRRARAGRTLTKLGELDRSIAVQEEALAGARRLGLVEVEVGVLRGLGGVHRQRGDPERAVELYDQALALAGTLARRADNEIGSLRLWKANALNDMCRYQEALAEYESLRDEGPPSGSMPSVLNGIGNCLVNLGDLEGAVHEYLRAVELLRGSGARGRLALYLSNIASSYSKMGRYQEAMAGFAEAGAYFEEAGQPLELSVNYLNRSAVYLRVSSLDLAMAYAQKALALIEQGASRRRLAGCLTTIGRIHWARSELDLARESIARAAEEAQRADSPLELAGALRALGDLAYDEGHIEQAADHYRQVLMVARASDLAEAELRSLTSLGAVEARRKRFDAARRLFDEALRLADDWRSPARRVQPSVGLARTLRQLGDVEGARGAYLAAAADIEWVRSRVGSAGERRGYFGGYADIYAELAYFLYEVDTGPHQRAADVFHYAEMCKARSFADRMQEHSVDPELGLTPELKRNRREILARYNYVRGKLIAGSIGGSARGDSAGTPRSAHLAELERLDEEYERNEGLIRQALLASDAISVFEPVSVDALTRELDDETLILEYLAPAVEDGALDEHTGRPGCLMLIVTAEGVEVCTLDGSALQEAAELVQRLRSSRRGAGFDALAFARASQRLFQTLVGPAAGRLEGKRRLIVVPDGVLATLPFEVLLTDAVEASRHQDPATMLAALPYLFRTVSVTYAPSVTMLHRLGLRRRGRVADGAGGVSAGGAHVLPARTLIVADPDYGDPAAVPPISPPQLDAVVGPPRGRFANLPYAGREGEWIAASVGLDRATLLTRADACEERLKSEPLSTFAHLHFAAHAYVDEDAPLRSSLILSRRADSQEDGLLTMREIYELELDADLVVLSSCETAMGQNVRGEGVVALARAFLTAGASSALVSLWPVDDYSTAEWMRHFYDVLAAGGSKESALRAARLSLLGADRPVWRLPYHWAPFVLIGEAP